MRLTKRLATTFILGFTAYATAQTTPAQSAETAKPTPAQSMPAAITPAQMMTATVLQQHPAPPPPPAPGATKTASASTAWSPSGTTPLTLRSSPSSSPPSIHASPPTAPSSATNPTPIPSTTSRWAAPSLPLSRHAGRQVRPRRKVPPRPARPSARTPSGGYWHKQIYPNQMWLDGAYMAEPFRASTPPPSNPRRLRRHRPPAPPHGSTHARSGLRPAEAWLG